MQHAACWFGQRTSAHARQERRFCCCDQDVVTTSASSLVELQDDCFGERCTCIRVGTVAAVAGGPTRRRPKRDPQTESLVTPYVINQTLVRGWIWAFQLKSYLMMQEPAASDEVLLFFLK